jgi:hypothetical protein
MTIRFGKPPSHFATMRKLRRHLDQTKQSYERRKVSDALLEPVGLAAGLIDSR